MTERAKYLIVEKEGVECAISFPEFVQHKQVVNNEGLVIRAAGFYRVTIGETGPVVEAFGESDSLGVKSRGAVDAEVIRFSLQMMGLWPGKTELTADLR